MSEIFATKGLTMGVTVEGFGTRIASHQLLPGDFAIVRLGGGTYLILRVDIDGPERYDLFLAELAAGKTPHRQFPFVRPSGGEYVTLPGDVRARPLASFAVPAGPGPGALVIDPAGRSFIRVEDDGTFYVALDTFKEARPAADREYYPGWKLVIIDGEDERVICTFPGH